MERTAVLDELKRDIERLKRDYERFFNGFSKLPPEPFRQSLQNRIRHLRAAPPRRYAERFRFNHLEARFNSLSELIDRRMRERETSTVTGPRRKASRPLPAPGAAPGEPLSVTMDGSPSAGAALALYRALYQREEGDDSPEFSRFHDHLQQEITRIRQRTGCDEVRLRLVEKEGKMSIKATPLGAPPSGGAESKEQKE